MILASLPSSPRYGRDELFFVRFEGCLTIQTRRNVKYVAERGEPGTLQGVPLPWGSASRPPVVFSVGLGHWLSSHGRAPQVGGSEVSFCFVDSSFCSVSFGFRGFS